MITLVAAGGGALAVVNEDAKSSSIASGGSFVSASAICAAETVSVQSASYGSGAADVRLKLFAGDAVTVAACSAPPHDSVNAVAPAVTLSLKLTLIVDPTGTFTAP